MGAASRAGYGDPEPNKSFKTYDRERAQESVDDGYTIDTRVERNGKRAYSTRSVYVNEEKRQGILRRKKQVVDYSRARFHRGGGFVDHGVNKSLAMPNTVSLTGDVAKSNIREYPYLPEWVKDSFAATTVRNPLNATDLYAASRLMVQSQAAADGKKVRGRKLRRLTQAERRFAEGRMMLYSPLGRGAVTTG